jgi:hypothetical protein
MPGSVYIPQARTGSPFECRNPFEGSLDASMSLATLSFGRSPGGQAPLFLQVSTSCLTPRPICGILYRLRPYEIEPTLQAAVAPPSGTFGRRW